MILFAPSSAWVWLQIFTASPLVSFPHPPEASAPSGTPSATSHARAAQLSKSIFFKTERNVGLDVVRSLPAIPQIDKKEAGDMLVTGLNDPASRLRVRRRRSASGGKALDCGSYVAPIRGNFGFGRWQQASTALRNRPAIVTWRHADVLAKAARTMTLIGKARGKRDFGKGEISS